VDNTNKILSTSLAKGVVAWFKANFHYKDDLGATHYYIHPNNMYNGAYLINSAADIPSLAVWTTKDGTSRDLWHETGTVHIDVVFGTYEQLAGLANQFNEVLTAMRAQILTNEVYIMSFLQDYTPGLLHLATLSETDMSKYRSSLEKKDSAYIHSFELTYKINIYLNQKSIWAEGKDYFSPNKIIYLPNSGVDLTVQS
jgi:hypothetical protein